MMSCMRARRDCESPAVFMMEGAWDDGWSSMHAAVSDVNRRTTLRNVAIFTVAVWSVGWIAAALQSRIVDRVCAATRLVAVAGDAARDGAAAARLCRRRLEGLRTGAGVSRQSRSDGPRRCWCIRSARRSWWRSAHCSGWTAFEGSVPDLLWVFAFGLAPSFVKNVFEEFAWRGYLTPKLHSLGIERLRRTRARRSDLGRLARAVFPLPRRSGGAARARRTFRSAHSSRWRFRA